MYDSYILNWKSLLDIGRDQTVMIISELSRKNLFNFSCVSVTNLNSLRTSEQVSRNQVESRARNFSDNA